jgi:hypothetical protein
MSSARPTQFGQVCQTHTQGSGPLEAFHRTGAMKRQEQHPSRKQARCNPIQKRRCIGAVNLSPKAPLRSPRDSVAPGAHKLRFRMAAVSSFLASTGSKNLHVGCHVRTFAGTRELSAVLSCRPVGDPTLSRLPTLCGCEQLTPGTDCQPRAWWRERTPALSTVRHRITAMNRV